MYENNNRAILLITKHLTFKEQVLNFRANFKLQTKKIVPSSFDKVLKPPILSISNINKGKTNRILSSTRV